MSPTGLFLISVMEKLGLKTHRELGKLLELPENHISQYMHGRRLPGYLTCLKIQEMLANNGISVGLEEIRPRK
jgi:plasmid maintenance system antidote protein VapI